MDMYGHIMTEGKQGEVNEYDKDVMNVKMNVPN